MKKDAWWLPVLLLLKFLLPFVLTSNVFELHRDEYLYYQQGQHLSWGYLENPPLIGLLGWLSSLPGGGDFWLKCWPALGGVATMYLAVKITKELGGNNYAQFLAAMGILFSAYLRIHFLFQPNFLDVFFWTLSAFFLLRYINTQQSRYIYFLALSVVFGWYGKYSILFFVVALLLSILLTKHRKIFAGRPFRIAVAGAAILLAPNLVWQYFHNWPLVHHMKELQESQLQNLSRFEFIKEQLLMLFPVLFVWIGGLVWLLKNKTYRVIGYCYVLIIFLLISGGGKGYYALGAYPMLLAAGGVWAERLTINRKRFRYVFTGLILVLSLPFVPMLLPLQKPEAMAAFNTKWGFEKMGLLKWEDGASHPLQQDFADMLGWKELTQKTEAFYSRLPDSIKATTQVYAGNYGIAGAFNYYGAIDAFKANVFSFNGSFLLWPPPIYFKHLLYVDEEAIPAQNDYLPQQKMELIDSCTNGLSRQVGNKIVFFRNVSDSTRLYFIDRSRKRRQQFGR